ncbi:MAG TPA: DUF2452 domain-containing protein [Saprospiraceae bacterium]|nr:DUF2452 domain-containing protein [Saprospiraceae bacterium]
MDQDFQNPISEDKVSDHPHLLPYAHHIGSAIIKPIDKGKTKGTAMSAMYQQTEKSLVQIKEQLETLIQQAQKIHSRIYLSETIYQAEMGFKPIIGKTYHLYERKDGSRLLSLVAPEEWKRNAPFLFIATVKLMADHTWEIINQSPESFV